MAHIVLGSAHYEEDTVVAAEQVTIERGTSIEVSRGAHLIIDAGVLIVEGPARIAAAGSGGGTIEIVHREIRGAEWLTVRSGGKAGAEGG